MTQSRRPLVQQLMEPAFRPSLNVLLYTHLIKHTIKDRLRLFDLITFYVRDSTFVAHARNIDLRSDQSIAMNCQLLHGFNNQPGLRDQVERWLTDGLASRSA
jgi:hypothetical protein